MILPENLDVQKILSSKNLAFLYVTPSSRNVHKLTISNLMRESNRDDLEPIFIKNIAMPYSITNTHPFVDEPFPIPSFELQVCLASYTGLGLGKTFPYKYDVVVFNCYLRHGNNIVELKKPDFLLVSHDDFHMLLLSEESFISVNSIIDYKDHSHTSITRLDFGERPLLKIKDPKPRY